MKYRIMYLIRLLILVAVVVLALTGISICFAGPLADRASCHIANFHGNSLEGGSGTLIHVTEDGQIGLVLTCAHLFDKVGLLTVKFPDGSVHSGELIRKNRSYDLAAVKIFNPQAKPVKVRLGVVEGEMLTACGFGPGKYRSTSGRLTGVIWRTANQTVENATVATTIRQGDSGGGLFNSRDELVGVVWGVRPQDNITVACFRTPLRNFLGNVFVGAKERKIFPFLAQPFQPPCVNGVCPKPKPTPTPACPDGNCPDVRPVTPQPVLPGVSILVDPRWQQYADHIAKLEAKLELLERTPGPAGPVGPEGPVGPMGRAGADGVAVAPVPGVAHYVLVADTAASYWPRLRDEAMRAQEGYSQIRITPPPKFSVGALPQLVAYKDGDPIGAFRGQREVEEALAKLARGRIPHTIM